ncbi:restriction endonuclease subunit S [Pallidibacillus thermolactis]|uniref:restriction endonuclease subunit S n=1 Tax=Pallidibacillus thermolactis TaxID=251051 RepID=UPI002E23D40D|nr:restriction endonuclease subunit S [Pallidibacillus thermolactis]MED1673289.1 restriction endonuclease subunit S [Pallidibacillus thermolactis subsp. kokeshiiformis]
MGFETVKLKDLTINLDNKRKPLNELERKSLKKKGLYPYCGANGVLDYIDEFIFDQEILCIAEDGGSWGFREKCAYIMNEPCWVNNHAHVLVAKENVNVKYLCYYLNYADLSKHITGTTRGKLTKSALEKIEVKIPDYSTQNKIVNALDKAQELIDKRKSQIEALDQLTQSVFLEMFGDPLRNNKNLPVVPLSNLAEIIMGQSPKGDSYNTKGDGTPLLNGPTEFGNTYPKEKQWTTNPKKICFKDDILFCVRGATAGRMNFADKEYCIGRGLAAIRCNNKNDIPFIYQTLKFLYKYFQSTSNGSTFINIDKKTLQNVPVLQVDNVQLEKYFTTIKKIEEQKKVLSESVLLLEENYNSIMQRAFKGELFTEEKVSNL